MHTNKLKWMTKFEVIFLTEAREFLLLLDEKSRDKIIFNIDKARVKSVNELFKKLKGEIRNLEHYITKLITEILDFGTRPIQSAL
jgi:hypothetical protein